MSHSMTAEELLAQIAALPLTERHRLFTLLGSRLFQDDNFTHEQVFGHLAETLFSAQEAAEYLEVSIATLRRHVQSGRLKPAQVVGRSQLFSIQDLKAFKRSLVGRREG